MTSQGDQGAGAEEGAASGTEFVFRYDGPSEVRAAEEGTELSFVGNAMREPVKARGRIKEPLRFREALSVLYAIVGSDYRYVPKDRTAYLAYLRQQQAAPKKSSWDAQKAYFDWLRRNDPSAWLILDPVISVQPDGIHFEVFSKDESTYARLSVDYEAFELEGEPSYGTTNIDFSKAFFDGVQRMRGYRQTWLSIGQEQVSLATEENEVLEKRIQVPDTWLRAFLQVQSAATLPRTTFSIAPMNFYNVLRFLRFHADQKGKGRGLRVELIPGDAPRLVLEPWEEVFESSAGIYRGSRAEVVRIWGRRRLMLLRRLLPFLDRIDMHLLGSGMPSFHVFHAGPLKLTLGLSGWTAANWAQAASFDLLLPRERKAAGDLKKVLKFLSEKRLASAEDIGKAVKLKGAKRLAALQLGCQQGQLMYELEGDVYHRRALAENLDWDRLEFRNDRERVAHDLLEKGAISIETENRIFGDPDSGTGLELIGKAHIEADQRDYQPRFVLTAEGFVRKVQCTCRLFRTHRLKQGPCSHLIALRLCHAREEERRRALAEKGELRDTVTIETKTYAKRNDEGEEICQMSLDHRRLKLRWGLRGQSLRVQNLVFNSTEAARQAYYSKVDGLAAKGYLDATEGGVS